MFSKSLLITIACLLSSVSAMPIQESTGNITETDLSNTTFTAEGFFGPKTMKLSGDTYYNEFSSDPNEWNKAKWKTFPNLFLGESQFYTYELQFRGPGMPGVTLPQGEVLGVKAKNILVDPACSPNDVDQIFSLSDFSGSLMSGLRKVQSMRNSVVLRSINKVGMEIELGGKDVQNPYVKWDIDEAAFAKNVALINPKTGAKRTVNVAFHVSTPYSIIPESYIKEAEAAGLADSHSTTPYLCLSSENGTPLCLGYSELCKKDPKIDIPGQPNDLTCKHYYLPGKSDNLILGNDLWRFYSISLNLEDGVAAFEPIDYKYAGFKIGQQ